MKSRLLPAMLALCILIGGVGVHSRTVAPAGAILSAAAENGGVFAMEIGNVRVQILSETMARIELKGPKGFEDRETFHITGRDWPGTDAATAVVGTTTQVRTPYYTISVPNNAVSLSGVTVTDGDNNELWRYTSLPSNNPYLPAPGDTPPAWVIADTPRIVPPAWGYTPQPADNTLFREVNGWDASNDAPDLYVFVPYRGEQASRQLRADFIKLTGESELVPLKALGLWHSRYANYTEQSALAIIDEYRRRGFPLDYFVIDTPWHADGSVGYEPNLNFYPNMERFLRACTDKNVNTVLSDHPEPQNGGHALSEIEVPFRNHNLRRYLNMGLDSWWYDRNWSTNIKSPWSGFPGNGISTDALGMYLFHYITLDNAPGRRPLVLSNTEGIDHGRFNRAPDLATHRYSIQWTGDIFCTSTSLRQEIVNAVRGGALTGVPYISADVGGHFGVQSPEQWIRWTQYAAFSPIFRYHSSFQPEYERTPWLYGKEAENIALDYIAMRYRLLPLFYALAHENYSTGLPLARRLDFNYPQYGASKDDTQYLLGDGILVAPLWEGDAAPELVPGAWLQTPDGQPGLKAEYFNNKNLSGTPVLTRTDTQVNNPDSSKSPGTGLGSINFSVRWTGKITVGGGSDVYPAFSHDDGVRVWIDNKLVIDKWIDTMVMTSQAEAVLKAGQTYDIRIEYYQAEGGWEACLKAARAFDGASQRDVFIPGGRWIDVWTGEEYTGPQTVTVTHGKDTSPVFVRSGTIIPLAENVPYSNAKPWHELSLDVYPSTQLTGSQTIYEDDGDSNAYKQGQVRTTETSTSFDNGQVVVSIGAAQGTFDVADAVISRIWNVRIHAPASWGALTAAVRDGENVLAGVVKIPKDPAAMPFGFAGGAPDGDVYVLRFIAPLTDASDIRLTFETPQDEDVSGTVEIEREVTLEAHPASVNLSDPKNADWVHLGLESVSSVNRKADVPPVLPLPVFYGDTYRVTDHRGKISFSDGAPTVSAADSVNSVLSTSAIELTVPSAPWWRELTLYIACWNATEEIEIYGEYGGEKQVFSFSAGGTAESRMLTIRYRSDRNAALYIKMAKTAGSGNLSLAAYTLSEERPALDLTALEAAIKAGEDKQKLPEYPQFVRSARQGLENALKTARSVLNNANTIQQSADAAAGTLAAALAPEKWRLIGDIDGDGGVNITDARLVLQHLVDKITLDGPALEAADVDLNNKVDITDARVVLQYLVGKVGELPV
ncbi:MAG: PA14 domain-containing protein [Oscillospiraceae bacterium]|nr:PA14 domain-containing protein [Oscillospiraceae bacterium]